MHYESKNGVALVRLDHGEPLIKNLNELARRESFKGAWLHGLGGAERVELGFYALENHSYQWQEFSELMEITSLQGNLAWEDGEPVWHIHGTFGKADYNTVGGHVKELIVGATCELGLHILQGETLHRKQDVATGLHLLELS